MSRPDQVSLQEEQLSEQQAGEVHRGGGRSRSSLRRGQQQGEHQAGQIEEESLAMNRSIHVNLRHTETHHELHVGSRGGLVFYGELTVAA